MNARRALCGLILSASLLAACSSTHTLQNELDLALEQHQLALAEKKLTRLAHKIPEEQHLDYRKKWQKISRQETSQIEKDTKNLLTKNQWSQALSNIRQARQRLGDLDTLTAQEEKITQHEQQTLASVRQKWMQARATTLEQQRMPLALASQGNSTDAHDMREWLARETPLVIDYLKTQSANAAKQKNWQQVADAQQLLERISPADVDKPMLLQARRQLDNARSRAQQQQAQQQRQQFEKLLESYQQQGSAKRLATLKAFTEAHRANLDQASINRVQQAVDVFVGEKTLQGDRAYAESLFREARNHWREAQQLAPASEALSQKLTRVERVLSSLKALEAQP